MYTSKSSTHLESQPFQNFQKKPMDINNAMIQKVSFLPFWRYFCPFDPLGLQKQNFPGAKDIEMMFMSTRLMYLESFREIKWMEQMSWVKKWNFGHFWGILTPLTPWGFQTRIFLGSRILK